MFGNLYVCVRFVASVCVVFVVYDCLVTFDFF